MPTKSVICTDGPLKGETFEVNVKSEMFEAVDPTDWKAKQATKDDVFPDLPLVYALYRVEGETAQFISRRRCDAD